MDGNGSGGPGAGGAGAGAGASSSSASSCPGAGAGPAGPAGPSEPGVAPRAGSGASPGHGSGTGTASGAGTGAGIQTASTGCGCPSHPAINAITVTVAMTTGGQFTLQVDQLETVDTLKKLASKKLRVPKERICLLYRERQLSGGTLLDHQIVNGSRLTLLPNVETGLLAQRPEQSVMQALESLNDGQVNDFLSGKAPLNLTMRFGDHMMLIQLQLSTVSPQASRNRAGASSGTSSSASAPATRAVSATGAASPTTSPSSSTSSSQSTPLTRSASAARLRRASAVLVPKSSASSSPSSCPASPTASRSGHGDMGPPANPPPSSSSRASSSAPSSPTTSPLPVDPLTSLPNAHACEALLSQLVDSAKQAVQASAAGATSESDRARTSILRAIDPNYRTSEELKSDKGCSGSSSSSSCPSSTSPTSCPASPKQGTSPVTRKVLIRPATFLPETANASTCTSACSTSAHPSRSTSPLPASTSTAAATSPSTNSSNTKGVQTMPCPEDSSSTCTCEASRCSLMRPETRVHTRALAEASRNLMQTLKQLSSEVLTNREEEDTAAARRRQGAIIESMHNHGKGVYSGTFSGTLNPALQDRFGRPKRDISTVIHILNDLLCATPQYRRSYQGLPQSNFVLEPNSSSTSSSNSSNTPSSGETTDTQSPPSQTSDDAENQATRGKVERLRLVMEERRERRRARREARISPYGSSQPGPQHWTAKSETQPAGKSSEAMDTEPLCDISPPEPVVA